MISPFALHFYAAYAPVLDVLHRRPGTAWLTKFYLPHFTETASPVLNGAHVAGFVLIGAGLVAFLAAAIPVVPELPVARGDEPLRPTSGAVSGTRSEPTVAPRGAERHEVGGVDEEVL